jgi:predicted ATPase/class 3 adenylate cyclase
MIAVTQEIDMDRPRPAPAGSFAFLFSDIEGASLLWEQAPEQMEQAVRLHESLVREAMEGHGGHVFKSTGDAFCVAFTDPRDAVWAAVAAQRALNAQGFQPAIQVRMAIHAGSAEIRGEDYFGPPLNRTARLMAAGHGGQIVLSHSVAAAIRLHLPEMASLLDLGEHRLKDLIEPEHAWQLQVPDLQSHFPPLKSAGSYRHNLPENPASFVGREQESRDLARMLAQHRLVTLVGTGGLGKTRLSLRVGLEQLGSCPEGVWFVELAPLSDPVLVAETVAATLSVPVAAGQDATAALLTALRDRKLLLILDNCEHLVAASASLARALVAGCPNLRILASSREALGVPGEAVFRMPVLAVPPRTRGLSAADAMNFPAIRLFVERAAAALGGFQLTDEQAPVVAAICKRLDGIPLAIELAAPRLKTLTPEALLKRLGDRFKLLTGGSRAALPRQQTLRALIDWSHDLLSPPERLLMRRLSVFAGGWTLDSAIAVVAGDDIDEWDLFDLMTSLVDKSLVVSAPSGTAMRYNFLESTREYAAEKLAGAGEAGWRRRLATYLATLLREAETAYETTPTLAWRETYALEIDNVRAALDWSMRPEGDRALGMEVLAYSNWLWSELGISAEKARRLEALAGSFDATTPPSVAARLLYMRTMLVAMGRKSGEDDARRAVELARQAADPLTLGRGLLHLARSLLAPTTLIEAGLILDEAVKLAREKGYTKLIGAVLNCIGAVAYYEGDQRTAQRFFEDSLKFSTVVGDIQGINATIQNVAELQFLAGEATAAISTARSGITAAREAEDREAECLISANLGAYLLLANEADEGASIAAYGLRQALALEIDYVTTWALQHLALAAVYHGRYPDAARLHGHVDAAYLADKATREPTEQASADLVLAALREHLDPHSLAALLAEGATLDRTSAVAIALASA